MTPRDRFPSRREVGSAAIKVRDRNEGVSMRETASIQRAEAGS